MRRLTKYHIYPIWAHLAVGILLVIAAVVWGVQYDVWNSTKLDIFGLIVGGKSMLVPNREIAEYDCEFTTAMGQIVKGRLFHSSEPSLFVYLPKNPQVFKVKGSGRKAQVVVVILLILASWQIITGVWVRRKYSRKQW